MVADQFMSQLRLRATPPAVPPRLVRRPQLEALLSRGETQPVTLLSAGPGSGKTLTVASWLSGGAFRGGAAWLTVDDTDNDLATFWADVLGALTVAAVLPADSVLYIHIQVTQPLDVTASTALKRREKHRPLPGGTTFRQL